MLQEERQREWRSLFEAAGVFPPPTPWSRFKELTGIERPRVFEFSQHEEADLGPNPGLPLFEGDPSAVPVLLELLQGPDAATRGDAALALGEIGPSARAAVPALIGLLKDERLFLRRNAARALGNMGPEAGEAVPSLVEVWTEVRNRPELRLVCPGIAMRSEVLGAVGEALKKIDPQAAAEAGVP
jgi:hypothetical protein